LNENKVKIRNAAINLFSTKGIHQTTLQNIAQEAEISRGTLFYYYPSKNELMYEVIEYCIDEFIELVNNAIIDNQEKTGPHLIKMVLQKILENDFLAKITFYLFQESMLGDQKIHTTIKRKYKAWREDTKQLLQHIEMKEEDLNATVAIIVGVIDGLTLQFLLDPESIDLENVSNKLSSMIIASYD